MVWWSSSVHLSSSRPRCCSFRWPSRVRWIARLWLRLVLELAVSERRPMTPDNRIRDEKPEREMSELDDRRHRSTEEEATPVGTKPAEAPEASGGIVQQIWRRIKEERNRPTRGEVNTRGQNNMDRSKAFLVLGTAV